MKRLAEFVKEKRKAEKLTQALFAGRAGVALTVIRKLEQGTEIFLSTGWCHTDQPNSVINLINSKDFSILL